MAELRITLLVENERSVPGIEAEHGLAYWIKAPHGRVLFDCGQTNAFARNAEKLGIDLTATDAIVISHGHYDHTGGLPEALRLASRAAVFAHPLVRRERHSIHNDATVHSVGMPTEAREAALRHTGLFVETREATEVIEDVWVTGEIPREAPFEDTGGAFYLDSAGRVPDVLPDDQALFIHVRDGVVVVLGCAHAGLVNTLRHIGRLTMNAPVCAVIGGMHLIRASEHRLAQTIDALRGLNLRSLCPCHCTGARASEELERAFPDRFVRLAGGATLSFPAR